MDIQPHCSYIAMPILVAEAEQLVVHVVPGLLDTPLKVNVVQLLDSIISKGRISSLIQQLVVTTLHSYLVGEMKESMHERLLYVQISSVRLFYLPSDQVSDHPCSCPVPETESKLRIAVSKAFAYTTTSHTYNAMAMLVAKVKQLLVHAIPCLVTGSLQTPV